MVDVIPTVAAIITRNAQVLLVVHGEKAGHMTGIYGLPSGRVEEGETEQQAIVREITEETGLTVTENDLIEFSGDYFQASIPRKDGTVKVYGWKVFKVRSFTGEIRGTDETTPEWTDTSDITKLDDEGKLLPNVRIAIEHSLKNE